MIPLVLSLLPPTDASEAAVHTEFVTADGPADDTTHMQRALQEHAMKTDMQLQKDVIDELKWQPRTRDAEIGVAVKAGVVTLTGPVTSYVQKFEAARLAERVAGVRAVADETVVKLPNSSIRTDADIAHSLVIAFKWNVDIPETRVTAKVQDGWVTIHGDVAWQYQSAAAEYATRALIGVRGVTNLVTVKQQPIAPEVVEAELTNALRRSATVDSERVNVESRTGGLVVLRGTVRSWTERSDAERAAWATPGVLLVQDELRVSA